MISIGPSRILCIHFAIAFLCLSFFLAPVVRAEVVVTFWSQELGRNFPHAFFTLHGTRTDGTKVRASYGFTAKAITPAILLGTVPGRIDETTDRYIARSNAHFSVLLTDAQHDAIMRLVAEWGENGDHRYLLNSRNCVHFVGEAMRRTGLNVVEDKKLMKKPRSFIQSIERLNAGHIRVIELEASQYMDWPRNETAQTVTVSGARHGAIAREPSR
ncbi:hypothetical protein [Sphingobium sp. CFD-2]|uniref:hypothetical protein n=1 Tax=Sphingobium sp. CFD-2 TaxID=2878542 RepID=UPI00214ADE64|nr:hypothetical protein [Sphingobium sp. CFD-2]